MKRTEALRKMAEAIVQDWNERNLPKLQGSSYYGLSIVEAYKYANAALHSLEMAGISPPPSNEDKWIDCGEDGGYVSYNHPQWDKE